MHKQEGKAEGQRNSGPQVDVMCNPADGTVHHHASGEPLVPNQHHGITGGSIGTLVRD
jgi:hypothetical protein